MTQAIAALVRRHELLSEHGLTPERKIAEASAHVRACPLKQLAHEGLMLLRPVRLPRGAFPP
jgi:hypothetical protein